jgi:hypothetical protein
MQQSGTSFVPIFVVVVVLSIGTSLAAVATPVFAESPIEEMSVFNKLELEEATKLIEGVACRVNTVCDAEGQWSVHPVRWTNDGKVAYVVTRTNPGYCGSGGCTENLLVRDGPHWRVLASVFGEIEVEGTATEGVRDIALVRKGIGKKRFVWNGSEYRLAHDTVLNTESKARIDTIVESAQRRTDAIGFLRIVSDCQERLLGSRTYKVALPMCVQQRWNPSVNHPYRDVMAGVQTVLRYYGISVQRNGAGNASDRLLECLSRYGVPDGAKGVYEFAEKLGLIGQCMM